MHGIYITMMESDIRLCLFVWLIVEFEMKIPVDVQETMFVIPMFALQLSGKWKETAS